MSTFDGSAMTVQATPHERPGLLEQLWKHAHDQLLSWFGIVGAAATLVSNSEGLFRLAYWLKQIAQHWIEITSFIWSSVFFLPHIEPFDAQLLNAVGFIVLNVLLSLRRTVEPARWQTLASALLAGIVITAIFQEGFARADIATPRDGSDIVPGLVGFAANWLLPVWEAYMAPYDLLFVPWQNHSLASIATGVGIYGLIAFWLAWGIAGGVGRLARMGAAVVSLLVLFAVYVALAVYQQESATLTSMFVIPVSLVVIGLPLIAALNLFSHFSPFQFDLTVFQRRLWQIIAAIALVLLADRSWLVFEKVASLAPVGI
jgi:hypothetical protein